MYEQTISLLNVHLIFLYFIHSFYYNHEIGDRISLSSLSAFIHLMNYHFIKPVDDLYCVLQV